MCAVSAVIRNVQGTMPSLGVWPYQPAVDLREVIARLDSIDKKMDAKDCFEPTKDSFIKQLEARIAELEAKGERT